MYQGRFTERTRDNNGNVVGRPHENPFLDMRTYIVEFEQEKETDLSANAIAESIYAQCDPEGNQYVLFD